MSASTRRAAAGSVVFFFLSPGVMAGLIPWSISGWVGPSERAETWLILGWLLVTAGLAVLIAAFTQFVLEGRGTPAPVAPTEELVVGGMYRYVRNPMYLAVESLILGQAALFGSGGTVIWGAVFALAVAGFVTFYEQPTLALRYGDQYADYCRHVPGWWPRLSPWRPAAPTAPTAPTASGESR